MPIKPLSPGFELPRSLDDYDFSRLSKIRNKKRIFRQETKKAAEIQRE